MSDAITTVYAFNLRYARGLVADVPDDQMATQPAAAGGHAVPNHPAWVLGHLARTSDSLGEMLGTGADPVTPPQWADLFGMKSRPTTDRSRYPAKDALLEALEDAHARAAAAYEQADRSSFADENPFESLRPLMPTRGDLVTFIMTAHEATHLGQLSAWRRAMGLPTVFG